MTGRRMHAQRAVLLGARDRGADTFVAFANSPPWWMTNSGIPQYSLPVYSTEPYSTCTVLNLSSTTPLVPVSTCHSVAVAVAPCLHRSVPLQQSLSRHMIQNTSY